jgi:hypothetical protein
MHDLAIERCDNAYVAVSTVRDIRGGGGAVHKNTFVMAGCTLTKTAGCLLWQFSIIFEANCYVYTLYSVFDTHFIKNITFTISQRDTFS